MVSIKNISPVARAIAIVGAVVVLATSVTFAALQSQATLTNSSISTTAELKLWNGSSFQSTAPGFTINNLVPGTGSGDLPFYFQNSGGIPLQISAKVLSAPTYEGLDDWNDLTVKIKNNVGVETPTTFGALLSPGGVTLLGSPLAAGAQGNSGVPGTEGNYTISFDIAPSEVTGGKLSVGNFDIVFTGVQAPAPQQQQNQ